MFVESGVLGYHDENQHEKDEDDQEVPIVEEDLFDDAKRDLVGVTQNLQEVDSEVLPEEIETNDVDEIQQDGQGIHDHIYDVDETL